jgi:Mg2+/Co2+ transporter CorB
MAAFFCVLFVTVAFGQESVTGLDAYIDKVASVATLVAGTLAVVITEVLNKYIGATKTNALLVALSVSIGIAVALVTYGVPNVTIASVFTISSGLFAVWRKVQQAIRK